MKSRHVAIIIVAIAIVLLIVYLPSSKQPSLKNNTTTQKTVVKEDSVVVTKEKIEKPKELVVEESTISTLPTSTIPDFLSIKDVKLKKSTFFGFMTRNIGPANLKVIAERQRLIGLIKSYARDNKFSEKDALDFKVLAKKYRVDRRKQPIQIQLESLKQKIDVVPPSLILAQSANESAWGTSRFARKGNNYFGQWCYSKGCGLVPAARDSGSTHEVAKFSSVQKSVEEYIYNINVGRSYKKIRHLREQMNNNNKPVDSLLLATGLEKYSERGKEYIKEIQSMIRYNKLQQYDN